MQRARGRAGTSRSWGCRARSSVGWRRWGWGSTTPAGRRRYYSVSRWVQHATRTRRCYQCCQLTHHAAAAPGCRRRCATTTPAVSAKRRCAACRTRRRTPQVSNAARLGVNVNPLNDSVHGKGIHAGIQVVKHAYNGRHWARWCCRCQRCCRWRRMRRHLLRYRLYSSRWAWRRCAQRRLWVRAACSLDLRQRRRRGHHCSLWRCRPGCGIGRRTGSSSEKCHCRRTTVASSANRADRRLSATEGGCRRSHRGCGRGRRRLCCR